MVKRELQGVARFGIDCEQYHVILKVSDVRERDYTVRDMYGYRLTFGHRLRAAKDE